MALNMRKRHVTIGMGAKQWNNPQWVGKPVLCLTMRGILLWVGVVLRDL